MRVRDQVRDFRRLVEEVMVELPAEEVNRIRHRPHFIRLMGEEAPMTVTRIVRKSPQNESSSSDFDFSYQTVRALIAEGYKATRQALSSAV
jgi:NTE family protein